MSKLKEYLGDSVYADCDGFYFILTTENGDGPPSNCIFLEPTVMQALKDYVAKIEHVPPGCSTGHELDR